MRVISGVVAMGMAGRLLILPALVMGMAVVGDLLGEGRVPLGLDREKNYRVMGQRGPHGRRHRPQRHDKREEAAKQDGAGTRLHHG